MTGKNTLQLAHQLGKLLTAKHIKMVTAESCTGGALAQAVTQIAGSSAWFDSGFVTYSNQAKMNILQVTSLSLDKYGAVSQQVAIEMAEGALINSNAELAIAITGIAGPTGELPQKPVGTVFIAHKTTGNPSRYIMQLFSGNRARIREQAVRKALWVVINEYKNDGDNDV